MATNDGLETEAPRNENQASTPSASSVRKELHWLEILNFTGQIVLAAVGVGALWVYGGQLSEMKRTNELTQKALDGSDLTLSKTLAKMQGQIDATNSLYSESQKQTANLQIQALANQKSANAAKSAADTAKQALVDGQRAVMALEDFQVVRELGNKGSVDGVRVNIIWKNSGNTATKNLVFWSNWHIQQWNQLFDPAFNFNDEFTVSGSSGNKVPHIQGFAAPQKSVAYLPIVIPRNVIALVQSQQIELVFWGEATYNDVFGDKTHKSDFCLIVRGFDGTDPFDATAKSGTTYPRFINCAVHNCHDDECKT